MKRFGEPVALALLGNERGGKSCAVVEAKVKLLRLV
jgi:hypothetical protein